MDAVRQWWFDTVWPVVKKLRWFVAAWVVLVLVAIPWSIRAQERSLESASRAALEDVGIAIDDVAFSGRSGVVTGSLTSAQRSRAELALAGIDGIRALDWRIGTPTETPSIITTTTTTTTAPVGAGAVVELKVRAGRIVVRGVLPDATSVAAVGSVAERLYGPGIGNGLTVDDVWAPAWFAAAPDLVAALPIAGDVDIVLDVEGVRVVGNVPSVEADRALRAAVAAAVGTAVTVDFSIDVADGALPTLEITVADDGTTIVTGSVPRRKLADEIGAAVSAISDGAEVANEISVDKDLADVYLMARVPQLVARVDVADEWTLTYNGGQLSGLVAGEGLFRGRQADPTARVESLLEELATLLIGNPTLVIEVETTTQAADDPDANTELARRRGFSVFNVLVRAGIDPDRICDCRWRRRRRNPSVPRCGCRTLGVLMLFAVFEIVFFLLLATLLGALAGWWLARSGRVSVTKAMDRSGAHAAADRELASAREEIARLSTKLNVATEAIRELETGHRLRSPEPVSELDASLPEVPAAPAGLGATEERAVPTAEFCRRLRRSRHRFDRIDAHRVRCHGDGGGIRGSSVQWPESRWPNQGWQTALGASCRGLSIHEARSSCADDQVRRRLGLTPSPGELTPSVSAVHCATHLSPG